MGWTFVEAALAAEYHVMTFNRGRTGADVPGVDVMRGDRESVSDLARLAAQGPWDMVFDTSGYVPAVVAATVRALGDRFGRYVFVSTVGAYRCWPEEPVTEQSQMWPDDSGEDRTGTASAYGRLKAGCELAVEEVAGRDRTVILRPGPVLGPRDNLGRLPWWLERCARGGQILAPGPADRPIQPVDVRDLVAFALRLASRDGTGVVNVAAPVGHATFGELDACLHQTGCSRASSSGAELVWVDPDWLAGQGLRPWTELPLSHTEPGTWAVDATRAKRAELGCRPLSKTVAATWQCMTAGGVAGDERWKENGIGPARERQLLSKWQPSRRASSGSSTHSQGGLSAGCAERLDLLAYAPCFDGVAQARLGEQPAEYVEALRQPLRAMFRRQFHDRVESIRGTLKIRAGCQQPCGGEVDPGPCDAAHRAVLGIGGEVQLRGLSSGGFGVVAHAETDVGGADAEALRAAGKPSSPPVPSCSSS